MKETRHLHLLGALGSVRTEQYNGRDHLVVPVVALMDGVIHAVNAEHPERVTASMLAKAAKSWNGRPLMLGHPVKDGKQIPADEDPELFSSQNFGTILNSRMSGSKLLMDAYVDPIKAAQVGGTEFLERLQAGVPPCEVSVGAYVRTDTTPGVHNGKIFKSSWLETHGDHLAFLPDGLGACSLDMGCGSHRSAQMHLVTAQGLEILNDQKGRVMKKPRTPLKERIKTFLKSLEAETPSEEESNESSEKEAAEETVEQIGYGTMKTLLDQVSTLLTTTSSSVDDLIADTSDDNAMEAARLESIQVLCMSMYSDINAVQSMTYKLLAPDLPKPADARYYEAFRTAIGKSISAKNMKVIQAAHDSSHDVHSHTTALGAKCSSGDLKAVSSNSGCSCGGRTAEGEPDMTKAERIKALLGHKDGGFTKEDEPMLMAMTDARLDALETTTNAGIRTLAASKADAEKVIKDKHTADSNLEEHAKMLKSKDAKKAEDGKDGGKDDADEGKDGKQKAAEQRAAAAKSAGMTLEEYDEAEYLKGAPQSIRDLAANEKRRVAARKTELVGMLKTAAAGAGLTEEQLKAKSLEDLETLAKFAKVDAPAVSFAGRGVAVPRDAVSADDFTPPDPYAEGIKNLRAAQSK